MSTCPSCSASVNCQADASCWCQSVPTVLPVESSATCLCPDCLTTAVRTYLQEHPEQAAPFMSRKPDWQKTHQDFQEGRDYYINKEGNWVFTGYYHLKKGYCCQNQCLHCPYGFSKKMAT